MTTATHHRPWAHRAGQAAGRGWRWYVHREQQLIRTLIAHGISARAARTALWVIKVAVLGLLLYLAFWLAVLLAFAVVPAWIAKNSDVTNEGESTEWREGHSGYGLYDKNEWRRDMGDPDQ